MLLTIFETVLLLNSRKEGQFMTKDYGLPILLNSKDAAKALSVSVHTLTQWAQGKNQPPMTPVRIGGLVKWRLDDIRALMEGHNPKEPN